MSATPGRSAYYWTFAALMALLAATVVAASLELGAAGPFVAFGIAAAKAVLVALFFMHLARRGAITWLFAVGGLVWLALLGNFLLADYYGRARERARSYASEAAGAPAPLPEGRPGLRRDPGAGQRPPR